MLVKSLLLFYYLLIFLLASSIDMGRNFPEDKSRSHYILKTFFKKTLLGKLVIVVNILSAKIKALKFLDRDSIGLILPIDDDQKTALFL